MSARSGPPELLRRLPVPPEVLRRLAAANPGRYPALFDSVVSGPTGRVSILAAQPTAALWLTAGGTLAAEGMRPRGQGFLDALEHWWQAERLPDDPAAAAPSPVFASPGWVVFLGYELMAEIEPRLQLPATPLPFIAFALRTPCALVHVLETDEVWAVGEPGAAREFEQVAADALAARPERAAAGVPGRAGDGPAARGAADPWAPSGGYCIREEDPARYLERVRRAQAYIRAGDIYQANLSRPWVVEPLGAAAGLLSAGALYGRLRERNPAPFASLLQWRGLTLLSSSPERLVQVQGREVQTRPIAGTRPRTRRPGEDRAEAAALVAHPKERAEHIMLIDLERNDLGKVCVAGSVRVDEFMVTETYAHVHHIVSNVSGTLRPNVTPIGAIRAVFPGGTITGVPKFRCMQLIAELEGEGRGAYTGSLGYLRRSGDLDLNILIRTMTLMDGRITLRAGGGIVADSDPERELNETRAKARGMLAVFEPTAGGGA